MTDYPRPIVAMHSCGGYYTAYENADRFHRQPDFCVVPGTGRCHDTPKAAMAAWEANVPVPDDDDDVVTFPPTVEVAESLRALGELLKERSRAAYPDDDA